MYQSIDSFYWQIFIWANISECIKLCILHINIADKCTHNAIALLLYNFWYFHFSTSSFLYSCSHPCYCYVYTYLHMYIYTFCDTDAIHKMQNNILKSAQCIYHKFCTLVLWKNVFFWNIIKKSVIISRETTENADFCVNLLLSPFIL